MPTDLELACSCFKDIVKITELCNQNFSEYDLVFISKIYYSDKMEPFFNHCFANYNLILCKYVAKFATLMELFVLQPLFCYFKIFVHSSIFPLQNKIEYTFAALIYVWSCF